MILQLAVSSSSYDTTQGPSESQTPTRAWKAAPSSALTPVGCDGSSLAPALSPKGLRGETSEPGGLEKIQAAGSEGILSVSGAAVGVRGESDRGFPHL